MNVQGPSNIEQVPKSTSKRHYARWPKKEHKGPIRLGQDAKSAVAEHVNNLMNPHEIDWDKPCKINSARGRQMREAMHIHVCKPV